MLQLSTETVLEAFDVAGKRAVGLSGSNGARNRPRLECPRGGADRRRRRGDIGQLAAVAAPLAIFFLELFGVRGTFPFV